MIDLVSEPVVGPAAEPAPAPVGFVEHVAPDASPPTTIGSGT